MPSSKSLCISRFSLLVFVHSFFLNTHVDFVRIAIRYALPFAQMCCHTFYIVLQKRTILRIKHANDTHEDYALAHSIVSNVRNELITRELRCCGDCFLSGWECCSCTFRSHCFAPSFAGDVWAAQDECTGIMHC